MTPFLLSVDQPGRATRTATIDRLPFVIGRSSGSALQIEGPGVWEDHLTLHLEPGEGLVATVREGAMASVQGSPIRRQTLHSGQEIVLGDAVVRVHLGPVAGRRSLGFWSLLAGLLIGTMLALQGFLAWRLAP